ncbi:hypothetical protein GGI20_001590 [Coemansia sp. BCRC 34301]|nr:hypothetical protein GGI20_001590 [Coemansia sp. BCRC 34301]
MFQKYDLLLKSLLLVCRNFYAAVRPRYYKYYILDLEKLVEIAYGHGSPDSPCKLLDHPAHHLVKDLTISVQEEDIQSGKILDILSRPIYAHLVFPRACNISFVMSIMADSGDTEDSDDTDDSGSSGRVNDVDAITAFVQWIRHAAPNVSKIGVHSRKGYREQRSYALDDLVSQLYQLVSRIEFSSERNTVFCIDLNMARNLTHIEFSPLCHNEQAMQLAQQSSQTLASLRVTSEEIDIMALMTDSDGDCVIYPQLLSLKLEARSKFEDQKRLVFSDAVPFPSLQRLCINQLLPFDDDTPFRGNAATLRVLEVQLNGSMVAILRRLNVFTPFSHPALEYVGILLLDRVTDAFSSAAEYMQFMLSIGSRPSFRVFPNLSAYDEDPAPVLSALSNHSSIQFLYLYGLRLQLWDGIGLVMSLPLLSDLLTLPPILGELPQGVSEDELPNYVLANYALTSTRFRRWHFNAGPGFPGGYAELATCVLLLALAIPTFNYSDVGYLDCKQFIDAMNGQIAEPRFSPYVSRLKRLFRDD